MADNQPLVFREGPPRRFMPVSSKDANGYTFHGPIGYEEITCDGCGACCMSIGIPPFDLHYPFSEFDPETIEHLPADLKHGLQTTLEAGVESFSGKPCIWLDNETRRCRNYDWRPDTCRDFEPGGLLCLEDREANGIRGIQLTPPTTRYCVGGIPKITGPALLRGAGAQTRLTVLARQKGARTTRTTVATLATYVGYRIPKWVRPPSRRPTGSQPENGIIVLWARRFFYILTSIRSNHNI